MEDHTDWKKILIVAAIGAVTFTLLVILAVIAIKEWQPTPNSNQTTQPAGSTQQNQSTIDQSQETPEAPKLVCKRFHSLDEALANVQIACSLDLSNQNLSDLPARITELTKLNELWLNNNHLSQFPQILTDVNSLMSLYLSNNQLQTLPSEIARLQNLQSLDLSNNQLTTLPSLQDLHQLHTINLAGNNLSEAEKENLRQTFPSAQITF